MYTESVSILDEEQNSLLIHCAIHFGNNLNIMLEYYKNGGPGVCENFSIENIIALLKFQSEDPSFIEKTLHIEDQQIIKSHVKQYHQLQDVYDSAPDQLSKLICDLILTEEHNPSKEIDAIISIGGDAEQRLLTILELETFHSPLAPGYGLAPYNAARALGKIQSQKAIEPIFNLILRAEFEQQEILIQALKDIGQSAKTQLLEQLTFSPFTVENECAAICLSSFCPDAQVSGTAKALLDKDLPDLFKDYVSYLI
jgi:hypothetical protein